MTRDLSKLLILTGLALVVLGVVLRFPAQLPWLGKLPGDFCIKKGNFSFYFPLTTCVLVSLLLTLVLSLFKK